MCKVFWGGPYECRISTSLCLHPHRPSPLVSLGHAFRYCVLRLRRIQRGHTAGRMGGIWPAVATRSSLCLCRRGLWHHSRPRGCLLILIPPSSAKYWPRFHLGPKDVSSSTRSFLSLLLSSSLLPFFPSITHQATVIVSAILSALFTIHSSLLQKPPSHHLIRLS